MTTEAIAFADYINGHAEADTSQDTGEFKEGDTFVVIGAGPHTILRVGTDTILIHTEGLEDAEWPISWVRKHATNLTHA